MGYWWGGWGGGARPRVTTRSPFRRFGATAAIGLTIFVLFVVTIIICFTCSCCCLYKMCRRPRRKHARPGPPTEAPGWRGELAGALVGLCRREGWQARGP